MWRGDGPGFNGGFHRACATTVVHRIDATAEPRITSAAPPWQTSGGPVQLPTRKGNQFQEPYSRMARNPWMYTGDVREGITYAARPGVENDRYSRPDELVWRYTTKERLIDLVRTRKLFFTRVSRLIEAGDPFEASLPVNVAAVRESAHRMRGVDVDAFRKESEQFHRQMLQTVLVSCWHKREFESRPMWERYGKGRPAVAIVTTLDDFICAMPEHVTVGHVEYVDLLTHQSYSFNLLARCFLKGRELEDEREVRAALEDPPVIENGRWSLNIPEAMKMGFGVDVCLERLISKIVISPATPEIQDEVAAEVAAAGLSAPVTVSELLRRPEY